VARSADHGCHQAEFDDKHAADPRGKPLFESGQIGFYRKNRS
jgi:hypothetical protein